MKDVLEELLDLPGVVLYWVIHGALLAFPIILAEVGLSGEFTASGFALALVCIGSSVTLRWFRPVWRFFIEPTYYLCFLVILFRTTDGNVPLWVQIVSFIALFIEILFLICDIVVHCKDEYAVINFFTSNTKPTPK